MTLKQPATRSAQARPLAEWTTLLRWFDAWAGADTAGEMQPPRVDWIRVVPFIFMHLMCIGVLWVGWSWIALFVAATLYVIRMFAITAFYHRYFSHRTFKTSRKGQFVFAVLGSMAIQRGPLWWAAHHRHHHRNSDLPSDRHSPQQHGFLWSHMGWFTARANFRTDLRVVRDLAKFPELCFLDRFDVIVAFALATLLYGLGAALETVAPALGTSDMQMLIWGFFVSTVVLYHATYTINSLAHQIGRQRYDTGDKSGNSFLLALITLGEGWHNNHHHYPMTVRQGFYWWEFDPTYYVLKLLAWTGFIWDLKPVPSHIRTARRLDMDAAA